MKTVLILMWIYGNKPFMLSIDGFKDKASCAKAGHHWASESSFGTEKFFECIQREEK